MTVLYEYTYWGNASGAMLTLLIALGATLFILWEGYASVHKKWLKIIIVAFASFITTLDVFFIFKMPDLAKTTRYKIKVEDKVDLNEFLMQYKIVETEGDIIVVEQVEHGE